MTTKQNLKYLFGMMVLTIVVLLIVLAVVFSSGSTTTDISVAPTPAEASVQPADDLVTPLTTSP